MNLDPTRWKQVQNVFHHAISLAGDERQIFLHQACDTDPALGDLLQRLLDEDAKVSAAWEDELAGLAQSSLIPQVPALPAEDLGPYQFIRLLGQGGMGAVYQAKHRLTGQIVAIKVLRASEFSLASRERFATEQRALARLNHPSIARLYGSEKFRDGTPCFVMEYVEGEPLTSYCHHHRCSIPERILLFKQVCEAVQHAHEHAIIHRDLKPSNIFVKPDGSVRLLDFGVAKQLDAPGHQSSVTSVQPPPVTLRYAAPEQLNGENVGTHTDVYALGVTLYELLTGHEAVPLDGLTPLAADAAIRLQNPQPPSRHLLEDQPGHRLPTIRLSRTASDDLDLLCATAIHKEPQRRYRSVEALIRDLDHWLRNEPLDARPDTFRYRLVKFVQRNRRPLTLTVSIAALAIAATTFYGMSLANAHKEALRQQIKAQRVENFVLSLFDNGDHVAGPTKSATALTMLDRGRIQAQTLKNDTEFQTELYSVLGTLYGKLGRFDEANNLLQMALASDETHKDSSSKARPHDLIALGLLRNDQSQFPAAEKFVRQGLDLLRQNPRAGKQDIALAESDLASVLIAGQNFKNAIPLLEDALRIQAHVPSAESDEASTLNRLADAQQEAGNYPEAVTLNQRALSIDRQLYGAVHPRVADIWQSLGNVHQMQHRYPEAVYEDRQALHVYQQWYGNEHPKTLQALLCLGQALLYEGQYNSARQTLTDGVDLSFKVLGPNDQLTLLARNALGTLEQRTGHFPAAKLQFERFINGSRITYGNNSYPVAVGITNLATLQRTAKHYHESEILYNEALADMRTLLPADHPAIATLELNLGKTLFYQHKYADSQANLQAAVAILCKATGQPPNLLEEARDVLRKIPSQQSK